VVALMRFVIAISNIHVALRSPSCLQVAQSVIGAQCFDHFDDERREHLDRGIQVSLQYVR